MDRKHVKYKRLLDACTTLPPTPTAVVHPCDESSLRAVVDAAGLSLIAPILVGPRARIEAVAREHDIDISPHAIVDAPYSQASAAKAVDLVREGRATALMKGSLHTDELMGAVVRRETGLRTARRVSHCFVMDVPSYSETLIVTDAAVNIAPTLADKVDIVQNAIDLAYALRFAEVRVAILSVTETINPKVPSTVEAAALCKMADRGQITGAIVDGPLALDNAISLESAGIKRIDSPVAGRRSRQRAGRTRPRGRLCRIEESLFPKICDRAMSGAPRSCLRLRTNDMTETGTGETDESWSGQVDLRRHP